MASFRENKPGSFAVATLFFTATILTVALGLTACNVGDPSDGTLVVGTNVWLGYEPLYLARELELFGLPDIKLAEFSSSTQVLRAFRNQSIQVAALTLDEALMLRENGIDVRVILVTDISEGADVILASPGISVLNELKGKRIAVEKTALGAYVLTRALQKAGLTREDVTAIHREIDSHEKAVAGKEVDAVVTFEPVRSRLLAKGMIEVFDSSMIPNEIVDVLVVRGDTLDTKGRQLALLAEGWFTALAYLDGHPDEAATYMAPRLRIGPEALVDAYKGLRLPKLDRNLDLLDGDNPPLAEISVRLAEVMTGASLLKPGTNLHGLACPDVLNALKARNALENP